MSGQQEPVKRGRKPLAESEKKTGRVELRVHPEKKQQWQEKAEAAGMSLNAWAEATLDRAKK